MPTVIDQKPLPPGGGKNTITSADPTMDKGLNDKDDTKAKHSSQYKYECEVTESNLPGWSSVTTAFSNGACSKHLPKRDSRRLMTPCKHTQNSGVIQGYVRTLLTVWGSLRWLHHYETFC